MILFRLGQIGRMFAKPAPFPRMLERLQGLPEAVDYAKEIQKEFEGRVRLYVHHYAMEASFDLRHVCDPRLAGNHHEFFAFARDCWSGTVEFEDDVMELIVDGWQRQGRAWLGEPLPSDPDSMFGAAISRLSYIGAVAFPAGLHAREPGYRMAVDAVEEGTQLFQRLLGDPVAERTQALGLGVEGAAFSRYFIAVIYYDLLAIAVARHEGWLDTEAILERRKS